MRTGGHGRVNCIGAILVFFVLFPFFACTLLMYIRGDCKRQSTYKLEIVHIRKVTAGLLVLGLLLIEEPSQRHNVGVDLFAVAVVRHDAGISALTCTVEGR